MAGLPDGRPEAEPELADAEISAGPDEEAVAGLPDGRPEAEPEALPDTTGLTLLRLVEDGPAYEKLP